MVALAHEVLSQADAVARARELARKFASTAAQYDETAEFPFANFDDLHAAGLLNLTIPKSAGGHGQGLETACRVIAEIASGEPSTALVMAMHLIYHAAPRMQNSWNPDVVARMQRDSIEGVALINVMRVEPELGTPARGGLPATIGTRTANGWRVNGHKLYSTGSPLLKYFLTWGRTDENPPRIGWFVIPRGTPGMRIEETWNHMGMRATGSHDLILEDAEIPEELGMDLRTQAEWLAGDPGSGVWNNLVLASLYSGIAHAARDWLAKYLHERVPTNLGASLATLPRMQAAMGEIETLLFTNDRLLYGLAAEVDRDGASAVPPLQTSMAKSVATNNAVKAVDIAMSLVGNPGLSRSNDLERHHRDVLCSRIHMPQDDIVMLNAGKAALGVK